MKPRPRHPCQPLGAPLCSFALYNRSRVLISRSPRIPGFRRTGVNADTCIARAPEPCSACKAQAAVLLRENRRLRSMPMLETKARRGLPAGQKSPVSISRMHRFGCLCQALGLKIARVPAAQDRVGTEPNGFSAAADFRVVCYSTSADGWCLSLKFCERQH
jgi:hypothetical protein